MNPLMINLSVRSDPKVLVALDFSEKNHALAFISQLSPDLCRLKVGKELFTIAGPEFVKQLTQMGFEIFLDLKFHDIPHTVAQACRAAAEMGVWMLNVHASGGRNMMLAAKAALADYNKPPLLIGVTVLTSMDDQDLRDIGVQISPPAHVLHLSKLAQSCGLDGVVCSAQEASLLRAELGHNFLLVTPGIRLTNSTEDDQRRILTPVEACAAGANYLVIGRPIAQSKSPLTVLAEINHSILPIASSIL
ncbi:MAG: orotidine-5'-phosphate decarboxylase [Neisseriaceae bacterium]|nr:orotidine-5'-phosphate decarboxylase [Neisseriaceae bacterium]